MLLPKAIMNYTTLFAYTLTLLVQLYFLYSCSVCITIEEGSNTKYFYRKNKKGTRNEKKNLYIELARST